MKNGWLRGVNYNDLALICGNMSRLYGEGITFINIIELIEEVPLSRQYINGIKEIKSLIKEGNSLYFSFSSKKEIFPKFFLSMIDIGEKTGKIDLVLKGLETYYSKVKNIKKTIYTAMIYPCILSIALFFMIIFGIFVALPSFADIYISMGKEVPTLCNEIINIKHYISENKIVTLSIIICYGIIIPYILFSVGIKEKIFLLLSKIKVYKMFNEYIAIVLFSVIFNSGISISKGLEFCSSTNVLKGSKSKFDNISKMLYEGKTLTEALSNSDLFSNYSLAHIRLGDESGSLDRRFALLEKELYEKIIFKVNKDVEMIQPIMIVFIGTIILSFIIFFILPLFNSLTIG